MRKSLVFVAAVAVLSPSALGAKAPPPGPLQCPAKHGKSADPYYGVTASQNLMLPIHKPDVGLSGQYKLNLRTGTVALVKAVPQGINPTILMLKLRVLPNGKGGFCVPLQGSFDARPNQYKQVTITDRKGRSITVDVLPLH